MVGDCGWEHQAASTTQPTSGVRAGPARLRSASRPPGHLLLRSCSCRRPSPRRALGLCTCSFSAPSCLLLPPAPSPASAGELPLSFPPSETDSGSPGPKGGTGVKTHRSELASSRPPRALSGEQDRSARAGQLARDRPGQLRPQALSPAVTGAVEGSGPPHPPPHGPVTAQSCGASGSILEPVGTQAPWQQGV